MFSCNLKLLLRTFEGSVHWAPLSQLCDDSNLDVSIFKQLFFAKATQSHQLANV